MVEVVAALIWQGNKFMICQRPAHKARGLLWEFVGGKVEPGETKERALIRECKEELNIHFLVNEGLVRLEEGEAFDLQQEMQELISTAQKKVRVHERFLRHGRVVEWIFVLLIMAIVAAIIFI